jgi:hypothetical protein
MVKSLMTPMQQILFQKIKNASRKPTYLSYDQIMEIVQAAEIVGQKTVELLPKLQYIPKAIARGHRIGQSAHVQSPGVKFSIVADWDNTQQKEILHAFAVIAGVIRELMRKNSVLKNASRERDEAWEYLRDSITAKHGGDVQERLDALTPDMSSSQKAQDTVEKNKARSRDQKRQHALRDLADLMRRQEFTEEEVLEAWQISQVERVMES